MLDNMLTLLILDRTLTNGGYTHLMRRKTRRYVIGNGRRGRIVAGFTDSLTALGTMKAVSELNAMHSFVSERTAYSGFGTWLDPDTGLLHIDPVAVTDSKIAAVEQAKIHGEKAIYDLHELETIQVQ